MKFRVFIVISAVWMMPLSGIDCFQSQCRNKIEKNSVLCLLQQEGTINQFEFNLCTHAAVLVPDVLCENETCKFKNTSATATEKAIKWSKPHYQKKLGLFCPFKIFMEEFLSSDIRRSNTVMEYETLMIENGVNFLLFRAVEDWNELNLNKSSTTHLNFFTFLEELAKKLHDRDLHIGLMIPLYGSTIPDNYDLAKLSNFIDWFSIDPHQASDFGYVLPLVPLSSPYGNVPGTTKYWIEYILQWIKPECLILDLGPWAAKFTAESTAVEPGPGSKAPNNVRNYNTASDVCYQLLVDGSCREYWDNEASTPWAVCGNDVYVYDNARSLSLKVDVALQYNITRLLMWGTQFDQDNVCGDGDPLIYLRAIQGIRNA